MVIFVIQLFNRNSNYKNSIMKCILLITFYLFTQALLAQGFSDLGNKKYNNVYAAVIGISDYSSVKDLEYADKDAQLFYDILNLSFPDYSNNFTLVQNENANERAIKQAIYSAQKNANDGDLVIIYFSGHGDVMMEPGAEEGFFLAHDASDSREYFVGGAIEFDWINKMTTIATSKKAEVWLITDACHAGKVINQESVKATMSTLNSNFENTTKFISCQAHELSFEYESIQHGAFTYFLAKCLSGEGDSDDNNTLNVDEISSYLKKEVRQFTNNRQSPKLTTSDEFKPFINISSQVAGLIKDIDENPNSDLASRGKGNEENVKSAELVQFEKAIYEERLYGSESSAKKQLGLYKGTLSEREVEIMTNLLIDALLNRAQRNTNIFLNGRPIISPNESLASTELDLLMAAELLGEDHFMYSETIDRSHFFKAMKFVQNDNVEEYSNAEKDLLALQKRLPKAAYINQGLGLLYVKMAKDDEAQIQLEKAQGKVSTWSKPRNTTALINISNGNLDKASKIIDEAASLDGNATNVSVLKSKMYSANLELQSAEEVIANISISDDGITESEYYALKARINQLKGRISLSESLYLKALKSDKDNINLMIHLGDLYKADGDTSLALKYYRKALEVNEENIVVVNNINLLSGSKLSTKTKRDFYSEAEVLSSVDLLLSKGEKEEAKQLLKQALNVSKFNPELDYALGKVFYSLGELEEAKKSLEQALEKSPYHFESIKSLTFILILEKEFTQAEAVIEKYNDRFRSSAKWKVFTYEAYKKMQKKENAIFALEEAIKIDSTDTEAYKSLYRLHMENGDFKTSEIEYKRLHKLGGRMKDSTEFVNQLISSVDSRILNGFADRKAVQGLQLILKYDQYFLSRMLNNARQKYHEMNYKVADIYLEEYKKYLFAMQGEMKYEYFRIKAYLLLEVKMYQESLDLFKQVTKYSKRECYIGVAMAKYELGHGEEGWMLYFRQAKDLTDLNASGKERLRNMNLNKGYHTPGGR